MVQFYFLMLNLLWWDVYLFITISSVFLSVFLKCTRRSRFENLCLIPVEATWTSLLDFFPEHLKWIILPLGLYALNIFLPVWKLVGAVLYHLCSFFFFKLYRFVWPVYYWNSSVKCPQTVLLILCLLLSILCRNFLFFKGCSYITLRLKSLCVYFFFFQSSMLLSSMPF